MRIGIKLALVLGLTLAILVPLMLVRGVIHERQQYRAQAVQDIVRSYAGPQAVAGPVLTVPYTEILVTQATLPTGETRSVRTRQPGQWTFFPKQLRVSGPMTTQTRRRGIYEVPVYTWQGDLVAAFDVEIPADNGNAREIGRPWLSYGIADVRGLRGVPRFTLDGRVLELAEGHGARAEGGLHLRLAAPAQGSRLRFTGRLQLPLAGVESLAIAPVAKQNRIDLHSKWPHPSFQGMSPMGSSITANGFSAQWQVASVATEVQRGYLQGRSLRPLAGRGGADRDGLDVAGVVLADPVDTYTLADRATKYGLLFVLLTFAGFFMFELIRSLPIHPIQYGLVGLAIAVFFLLLVSLSEHIAFGLAYLAASAACLGLIGFYLSAVLRSALRGTGFAAMLALLYAALYGLLISEDNALVLGAGLLFLILAAVMVVTRKVDWYRLSVGNSQ